jgi:hypothetical protein
MRQAMRVMIGGALALAGSTWATSAQGQTSTTKGGSYVVSRAPSTTQSAAYLGKESDFVVGKKVYLRSTKTFIGTIEKADESHSFPPSFPKTPAKAIMIRRKDRSRNWLPVEGITRIYVVNK